MSTYSQIERELERELDRIEEDFADGLISQAEYNRLVRDAEREARAELRAADEWDAQERDERGPWGTGW